MYDFYGIQISEEYILIVLREGVGRHERDFPQREKEYKEKWKNRSICFYVCSGWWWNTALYIFMADQTGEKKTLFLPKIENLKQFSRFLGTLNLNDDSKETFK